MGVDRLKSPSIAHSLKRDGDGYYCSRTSLKISDLSKSTAINCAFIEARPFRGKLVAISLQTFLIAFKKMQNFTFKYTDRSNDRFCLDVCVRHIECAVCCN